MGYDRLYFLKKAFALYPGVSRPRSATPFRPYYARRRAARGPGRALLDLVVGLAFLAWIPWRARRVQRRFGLDPAWRRRAVRIARTRFADPNDLALFRIADAAALDGYIRRFEDAAFNKRINPAGWRRDCVLADKARFADRVAAADLPHPQTIALVDRGRLDLRADPAGRRLIAKPARGEGGDGVRLIGPVAGRAALSAALGPVDRSSLIVQALIAPHPALADLAPAALPTVRMVTILDEGEVPELVSATFRCAADPAALVDNMKAGGLIAPVEIASGRLGLACRGYGGGDWAVHPVTGGTIAGRLLPDWAAAVALARRAHAAFSEYALIGWDVALSPEGPVLVEGNAKPGVLMPQRAARRGLAQGRYGALLAHHLAMNP